MHCAVPQSSSKGNLEPCFCWSKVLFLFTSNNLSDTVSHLCIYEETLVKEGVYILMSSPLSLSQTFIEQSIFLFRKRMQTHKEQRHCCTKWVNLLPGTYQEQLLWNSFAAVTSPWPAVHPNSIHGTSLVVNCVCYTSSQSPWATGISVTVKNITGFPVVSMYSPASSLGTPLQL